MMNDEWWHRYFIKCIYRKNMNVIILWNLFDNILVFQNIINMKEPIHLRLMKFFGQLFFLFQSFLFIMATSIYRFGKRILHKHPTHYNPFKATHEDVFKSRSKNFHNNRGYYEAWWFQNLRIRISNRRQGTCFFLENCPWYLKWRKVKTKRNTNYYSAWTFRLCNVLVSSIESVYFKLKFR